MALGNLVLITVAIVASGTSAAFLCPPMLDRLSVVVLRRGVSNRTGQSVKAKSGKWPSPASRAQTPTREKIVNVGYVACARALRSIGLGSTARAVEKAAPSHQKRLEQIRDQLPGAIEAIGSSLAAGQSVQQSISYVAGNMGEPLASELRAIVWDLGAGKSLDRALDDFKKRLPMREVAYLCLAFRVQGRTGGSMRDVLDSACASLRDAAEFERTLRSSTAQARLSAKVVGVTPVVLLGFISLMSPGYIGVFFSSATGFIMLVTAIALDAAGVAWLRRIMKVG